MMKLQISRQTALTDMTKHWWIKEEKEEEEDDIFL